MKKSIVTLGPSEHLRAIAPFLTDVPGQVFSGVTEPFGPAARELGLTPSGYMWELARPDLRRNEGPPPAFNIGDNRRAGAPQRSQDEVIRGLLASPEVSVLVTSAAVAQRFIFRNWEVTAYGGSLYELETSPEGSILNCRTIIEEGEIAKPDANPDGGRIKPPFPEAMESASDAGHDAATVAPDAPAPDSGMTAAPNRQDEPTVPSIPVPRTPEDHDKKAPQLPPPPFPPAAPVLPASTPTTLSVPAPSGEDEQKPEPPQKANPMDPPRQLPASGAATSQTAAAHKSGRIGVGNGSMQHSPIIRLP